MTIFIQGYQCMCGSWDVQKGHCGRVGGSWLGPVLNEIPGLSCRVALEPSSSSRHNEEWRGRRFSVPKIIWCPALPWDYASISFLLVSAFVRDHIREWWVMGCLRDRWDCVPALEVGSWRSSSFWRLQRRICFCLALSFSCLSGNHWHFAFFRCVVLSSAFIFTCVS